MIGSAIALNLLFHIPILWGVCITALDVIALLLLQRRGFRYLEALVMTLIGIIGISFGLEIIFSHPNLLAVAQGFIPHPQVPHSSWNALCGYWYFRCNGDAS